MNRETISYERNIHSSYMRVPALEESLLDVRIMLGRKMKGMIPVERCYINGKGQFMYDISGKQALDNYISIQSLEYKHFEQLILQICEQLELLEWNLLDGNGLQLDPQFIYLSHGEEYSFIFYPSSERSIFQEIRKLMEYLLTKLDHSETEKVHSAYELYELTLRETYQIKELKEAVLKGRLQKQKEETIAFEVEDERAAEVGYLYNQKDYETDVKKIGFKEQIEEKISVFFEKARSLRFSNKKEEHPVVVYPKEEVEEEIGSIHPTVCITSMLGEPQGVLLYEGTGNYSDFQLEKSICIIGKNSRADMKIERETISQFHAKIAYEEGYYIEDMNSTNGTFVNDIMVNYRERICLYSGDIIRFADVKYRFL